MRLDETINRQTARVDADSSFNFLPSAYCLEDEEKHKGNHYTIRYFPFQLERTTIRCGIEIALATCNIVRVIEKLG